MTLTCPTCGSAFDAGLAACPDDGAVLVSEGSPDRYDPHLGQTLGGYVVAREVAEGAMGRVYEGRDPATLARVAIKILHEDIAIDEVAVERFRREYETLRTLEHPHIIKVLAQGPTEDGSYFMVMEHLAGEELGHVLSRDGALEPARTLRLVSQLALALEHAHQAGYVHRDLKPENIYLCPTPEGDHVKVLDFGVVKVKDGQGPQLTAFGTALGSPCYMSPEQAMGKRDVDHLTDVFAIGAIMHELASGRICFDGSSVGEIMMRIVRFHPPLAHEANASYPEAYGDVVAAALSKGRDGRPTSARGLAAAMLEAFGLEPDVEGWAATPEAHIASVLSGATPPAQQTEVEPSSRPPAEADIPEEEASQPMDIAPPPEPPPPEPASRLALSRAARVGLVLLGLVLLAAGGAGLAALLASG